MPIPWLAALKVIPWTDVVTHAPKVLKAARGLMRTDEEASKPPPLSPQHSNDPVLARLEWLEGQLASLRHHQKSSAQTLADVAEDNARLVQTVQTLRRRQGLLLLATALSLALSTWVLWSR